MGFMEGLLLGIAIWIQQFFIFLVERVFAFIGSID